MSRLKVRTTPQAATEKWVRNLGQSQQAIEEGVNNVTKAPGQAAAENLDKYLAGVQESAQKWRSRVASVSLESWKEAMVKVGAPRVAQGAQQKQGKMQAFQEEFFPVLERNMQQVHAMPGNNVEQRIQKALAMMRLNHGFKRGQRGG